MLYIPYINDTILTNTFVEIIPPLFKDFFDYYSTE